MMIDRLYKRHKMTGRIQGENLLILLAIRDIYLEILTSNIL